MVTQSLLLGTLAALLSGCIVYNDLDMQSLFDQKIKEDIVYGNPMAQDKILIIPVSGEIMSAPEGGVFPGGRGVTPQKMSTYLQTAAMDPRIKGVVLDIHSPGGSAAASEDIYRQMLSFRKYTKKPVVSYFADTAASGAYYLAQGTNHIVANPNAITGSIGVISVFFSADKLLQDKLNIQTVTIKTGAFKDSGSPLRPMSEMEKAYWAKLIDQTYGRFLDVVVEGRRLPMAKVRQLAQGQVFTGVMAKEEGLVDTLGGLEEAIVTAQVMAKAPHAKAVRVHEQGGFGSLLSGQSASVVDQAAYKLHNLSHRILYMSL